MPINTSKGPSSSATSYILNNEPNVSIQAVLTTGDVIGSKTFGGTPDGIGAFDNGDGTITILLNHEIVANGTGSSPASSIRDHGGYGSWVDAIVMDKTTHAITSLADLGQTMYQDNDGDGVYIQAATDISRLCSADLADVSAYYNAATGMGTTARIFLNGEEQGIGNGTPTAGGGAYDSRAFAWIATGADKGSIYELPGMGNTSFENLVANPWTGDKTVVMIDNDTSPAGQTFMYIGNKTDTGNDIQKAGLVGGALYGIVAAGIGAANNTSTSGGREASEANPPTSGTFTLAEIKDATHDSAATMTGTQIQTAANSLGVTGFWRPEDGAWDPSNHSKYYFVTTSTPTTSTRIWSLTFDDLTHPENGGTFKMEFQGVVGKQVMFDNLTIDATNGHVLLNEDPGNYKGPSNLWDFNPADGSIHQIGQLDPALFGDGNGTTQTVPTQTGFSIDKETSGILDVTNLLGNGSNHVYLTDVQNHFVTGNPLTIEGGQLNILTVAGVAAATRNADLINGSYNAEAINGKAGDDTINGGSGNDTLDGAVGADVLNGDAGDDVLNGGAGDDNLAGGVGADTLNGGLGNDLMAGGDGNDSLMGAAGDDVLVGGLGADTLAGAAGNDTFRYASAAEGGDLVVGFRSGQDHFEFSAAGFGGGLVAGAEISLLLGKAATAATGQFVYDAAHGNLLWDVDGSGATASVVIAHFASNPHLTAEDFTIIA